MCVDPDLLTEVKTIIGESDNRPSVCCWASVRQKTIIFQPKIVLLNESHLIIISKKDKNDTSQISFMQPWMQIRKITHNSFLSLKFVDDCIDIDGDKLSFIICTIMQYVCNILSAKEMPNVDLGCFDYSICQKTYETAIYRLRAIMFTENIRIPKEVLDEFDDFIESRSNNINLIKIDPSGVYIPFILRAIEVDYNVDTLTVYTPVNGVMWDVLGSFLAKNTTIKSVITYEPITNRFQYFIHDVASNSKSALKAFHLMRAKITNSTNGILAEFFQYQQFKEFTIYGGFGYGVCNDFLLYYSCTESMKRLEKLTLDCSANFDIYFLLRISQNLKYLSVRDCNIQIGKFLGFLEMHQDSHLEVLDISLNKAKTVIKPDLVLPESIKEIRCRKTHFKLDNLLNFFMICSKKAMRIDVAELSISDSSFLRFRRSLDLIEDPKLTGLVWSGNSIDLELLDFLDRCEALDFLDISDCLDENEKIRAEVHNFLMNNMTIKKLVMRASSNNNIDVVSSIVALIYDSLTINEIDITGQEVDDNKLMQIMHALIANKTLRKLTLSYKWLTEKHTFQVFFMELLKRMYPLTLPPIYETMKEIQFKDKLYYYEKNQIKKFIEQIRQGCIYNIDSLDKQIEDKKKTIKKVRRVGKYSNTIIPDDYEINEASMRFKENTEEWDVLQPKIDAVNAEPISSDYFNKFSVDDAINSIIC